MGHKMYQIKNMTVDYVHSYYIVMRRSTCKEYNINIKKSCEMCVH